MLLLNILLLLLLSFKKEKLLLLLNNISKPCSLLLLSNNPSNKLFFCFFSLLLFKKLNKPCLLFSSFFISFSITFFISSLLSTLLFNNILSSILTLSCFCSSFWLLLLSSKFISILTSSGSTFSLLLSSFIWLPSSFWALTKFILSIFITLSNVGKIFSCISSFWLFSSSFSSTLSFIGLSFSFFSSSSFLLFFDALISCLILNRPLFSVSLPNKLDLFFLISRFPGNKGLFLFSSIIGWSEGFVSFKPGNKGDFIGFDSSLLGFWSPNPGNNNEVVIFFCLIFSVLVSGLFVKNFAWFWPKILFWKIKLLFLSLFSSLISSLLSLLFLLSSRVLYTFSRLPALSKILNEFFISLLLLFWFNALIVLILFSFFLSSLLVLDIIFKNGFILLFTEFVVFVLIVILLSLLSFLSPVMKFLPAFWFIYAVNGDWYFFSSVFTSFVIISFKVGLFSSTLFSNKNLPWDFISSLPFVKKGEKIFETLLFFKNISSVLLLSKPELRILLLLSNKPPNKLLFLVSFCSLLLFWNNFWLKNELLSCPCSSSNKLLLKMISFFTSFLTFSSFFSSFSWFFSSFISFTSSLFSSFIITLISSFSLILSSIISSFISPGSISISSWLSLLFCSSIISFWLFLSFESEKPNLILFESKTKLFFLGVLIFSLLFGTKPNFTFKLSSFTSLDLSTELLTFESLVLLLLFIIFIFVFSLFLNPNVTLADNGL